MGGLEIEGAEPIAPAFTGVVVAQVLTCEQHPNADKLHVCTVDIGKEEPVQIVCGAPNVRAGVKVPCATIGAVLPGDFKIKKAKLRGVESNGMLCSSRELGISEDHSGLWILPEDAPVGEDIRVYERLDDKKIEVKASFPSRISLRFRLPVTAFTKYAMKLRIFADASPAVWSAASMLRLRLLSG